MGEEAVTYSHYSGEGITVRCYDENGDLAAVRSIPWEDLGVDTASDTSYTYFIPETDRPYKYVVEYTTSVNTTDLIKQTFVTNTVTGKCGIAEAGELINPPGLDNIAVSKKATNIRSDHVTWEIKVDISNDSLDGQIKLSEAQANDKGEISDGLYRLPRAYIPSFVDSDGNTVPDRNCQEALEKLEIIGLEEGERVRVFYFSGSNSERYYDSDASMWHDGVLTMTGFQSSTSDRWPDNKFYMYFYKDDHFTPGLNEPEDGTRKRSVTVRMTNSFPVKWANYARDYINNSQTYRPGIFTHTNWVVVNGVKATSAFNTQPTYIYKHVINNGLNYTDANPITTVTVLGKERSIVYPVYRFAIAVNGINTDDPIVIDDYFDTSLFKLFDHRDFGGSKSFVEAVDSNGNHKYNWINWVKPAFGALPDMGWNGAIGNGPYIRADDKSFSDTVVDGYRVMENDDVKVEETDTGARFTFKKLDNFKKKNGQYYNFYIVDYYLVPRNVQALAELEKLLYNEETKRAPITNIASFRDDTTSAITYFLHKNNLEPVSKTYYRNGNEIDDKGEQHPRLDFTIDINPGKVTLNEGRNMEVRDVYSDSLSIDYRSVRVTTEPPANVSYDFSGNVGSFVIPDNTAVKITYTATIISKPAEGEDTVDFSNSVSVNGYSADISSSADVSVSSGGEAITPEIFIFKYRSNHMETGLNGAVFELLDENKQPVIVDEHPFHMTSEHDSVTDKDGQIHLKLDQQVHGFTLSADKFYYIHEITPPDNYYPSEVYYQFKIRTDGTVDYSSREYLNGDTLNVRNSPKSLDLHLVKNIAGNVTLTADDIGSLSFKLEKYNPETQAWEVHEDSAHNTYGDVRYSDFGTAEGGTTVFRNLEIGKYRLTETGNDAIKANHPGSDAYVRYMWDDNKSGTSPSMEFEVTLDHLDWSDNRTVTLTNTYSTETVDRKATKKWYNTQGNEINWPKGLDLQLNVVTLDIDDQGHYVLGTEPVKTVILDGVADNDGEFIAGTASFNGLPKYKPDGQTAQQYAVVEATVFDGYYADQTFYLLTPGDAAVLKNIKKSTDVCVTKRWLGALPDGATATLRLWGYSHNETSSDAKVLQELVVTAEQNRESVTPFTNGEDWLVKFTDVPMTNDADVPLNYFITETSCTAGYEPTYQYGRTMAYENGVIVNSVARTSFTVTKLWKNTPNNIWPADTQIGLTLKRKAVDGTADGSFSLSFNMSADSCTSDNALPQGVTTSVEENWTGKYVLRVEGLDKYSPSGSKWNYYVTEETVKGFTAIYQDSTHADVTASVGSAPDNGQIINTGEVYNLTVSKSVTGNFGDRQKEFTFTVLLTEADGSPFVGTLDYEKLSPKDGMVGKIQFSESGTAIFRLRHGESAVLKNIPGALIYTVAEELSGARGYTVESSANGIPREESDSPYVFYGPLQSETGLKLSDQHIAYVNDRSRLIATGVETGVFGSIAAFLLFTVGLAFVMIKISKKSREDQ